MGGDGSTRWGGHRRRPCVNEWTYTLAAAAFAAELRTAHPHARLEGHYRTTPGGPRGTLTVGPADGRGWRRLALAMDPGDVGTAGADLEPAPQPLGGVRWWLRCPRCRARRAVLYVTPWTGAHYRCRVCLGLAYPVQRLDPVRRAEHRMRKVVARLGVERPETLPDLPPKPPGMHWRTYERHAAVYDAANAQREARCLAEMRRLLASIERRAPHHPRGRR